MLTDAQLRQLAQAALLARQNAWCPHSGFAVGAALLGEDGTLYTGCNLENASYGATLCAERAALAAAVSAGCRHFAAIAIAGGRAGLPVTEFCPPCGICRQALAEFCGEDFPILLVREDDMRRCTLGELLPLAFHLNREESKHENV